MSIMHSEILMRSYHSKIAVSHRYRPVGEELNWVGGGGGS